MVLNSRKRSLSLPVFLLGLVGLIGLVLTGCASTPNSVYYRVDYQSGLEPAKKPSKLVLMVGRLDSTQPLTQPNIVHRVSANSLVFEPYSLWEATPVEMAKLALVVGFREAKYFKRVTTKRLSPDVNLIFRGRLERFEWVSTGGSDKAEVLISYELYDPAGDRVIASGQGERMIKASGKGLGAVAGAMTKALTQAVDLVVAQVVAGAGEFKPAQ